MPCLVGREKGVGRAGGAGTTGAAHSVDVVLDRAWKVVVDHILDVLHIKTSRCHIGRNQDRTLTLLELLEHPIALLLFLVAVDAQCGPTIQAHLTRELVAIALRGAEDQDLGAVHDLLQQALESAALVLLLHDLDVLSDGVRGTHFQSADVDVHWVLLADIAGQTLHLLGPRGTPHERLPVGPALAGDLAHLRLETHVQHAVGLIQGQILHVGHADNSARDKVRQPARCCDDDVGTVGELSELRLRVRTSIEASDANLRTEAEAAALLRDLLAQLTRGREHHAGGQNSALLHYLLLCQRLHGSSDDGREEGGRLTASRLRADHDVRAVEGGRDGVFLHGRGDVVTATLEVVDEGLGEVVLLANRCEGLQRLLLSLAADSLDIDILVLPEVEAFRNVLGPEE
mmetsp:Transcript_11586/g.31160  ORF Transcript_11586/g.31160 Transcript_11586/m.31160 type:complete len:401 (+) Transcript_11586:187-1389(+)